MQKVQKQGDLRSPR